jgi:hypothetical protein
MCELLGLSSNAPATVNVSLPTLAEHGRVSGTYNDGWGVGYYEGPDVRLMKDSAAVGDSEWIQFIANHNLRSQLVIAHTRKATRGTRSYPMLSRLFESWLGVLIYLHTTVTFQAYSNRADSRPIGSTQLARPTPSSPFVFSSTKWLRSGRCQMQRRRSVRDS